MIWIPNAEVKLGQMQWRKRVTFGTHFWLKFWTPHSACSLLPVTTPDQYAVWLYEIVCAAQVVDQTVFFTGWEFESRHCAQYFKKKKKKRKKCDFFQFLENFQHLKAAETVT